MTVSRATTLLAHHAPQGFHYDWLIDPPGPRVADDAPNGTSNHAPAPDLPRLWTARVGLLWEAWPTAGPIQALALPPHRRRYLNWSGPLSGGRGRVQVAAQGRLHIARWSDTRIDATLITPALTLGLTLGRPTADAPHWQVAARSLAAP